MRATLSLLQAWIVGIGVFVAMTAAFVVALIVAIAGPPSDEEMRGLRAASNAALRSLSDGLASMGADLCERFPQTAGADEFCPPTQTAETAPPATPPAQEAAPAPAAPVSEPAPLPTEGSAPELLGANGETVPIAAPPPRHRQLARRSHRASAHRTPRAQPRRMVRIEPHPVTAPIASTAPDAPALIDVHPATAHVIEPPAPEETPSQDEAAPREDAKPAAPDGPRQEQAPSMAL